MNFWLATIIAVVVGTIVGSSSKDKKFSWLGFFITFFLLLGGIGWIVGFAVDTLAFLVFIIKVLFWPAALIAVIILANKYRRGQKS